MLEYMGKADREIQSSLEDQQHPRLWAEHNKQAEKKQNMEGQ